MHDIFIKDEGDFARVFMQSDHAKELAAESGAEMEFSILPPAAYSILIWAVSHNLTVDSEVDMIVPDKPISESGTDI
jgi:hypothetical protein